MPRAVAWVLAAVAAAAPLASRGDSLLEYVKCQLCEVHHLSGRIEGCCTDVESVDATNERHFLPILHDLSKRTFFRYFKVDLWRPCPFWEEDGQCHMRDCAVCECDANEIPACWREQDGGYGAGAGAGGRTGSDDDEEADNDDENDEEHGEEEEDEEVVAVLSRVDVVTPPVMAGGGWALANGVQTKAPAPPAAAAAAAASPGSSAAASSEGTGEVEGAAVWTEEEEGPHVQYVNLLNNPEGYTAWAGPSAMRVWRAIYEENCFSRSTATTTTGKGMGKGGKAHGRDYGDGKHTPAAATATAATGGAAMAAPTAAGGAAHATDDDDDGVCGEERVFYRILSGLQTSINTHIAMTYNGGRGMARGTDVYTSGPATGKGVTAGGGAAGDGASGNPLQRAAAGVRAAVDTWLPAVGLWGLRAWGVLTGVPEKHAARLTRLHASAAAAAAGASPAGDGDDAHAGSHELVLSRGVTPSLDMYIQRIGQHPDRLNNLYFTFLFVLRAVDKAAPLLQALNYSTGNATEDAATAALVSRLLTVEAPAVLRGFDEKALPLMAGLDSWHKSTTAAAAAAVGAPAGSKGAPGAAGGGVQSSQADASTSAAAAAGGALGVDAVRGAELSDLIDRYKATGAAASSSGASSGASVLPKGAGALLPQATGGSGDFDPALAMRESWREKYRNISRIMDCIGCEKCRLWGKLQFLGLGTAMKILFAPPITLPRLVDEEEDGAAAMAGGGTSPSSSSAVSTASGEPVPDVRLTRNEVVALVNVLHRVSISVAAVGVMRDLDAQRKLHAIALKAGSTIIAVAVVTAWMLLWRCRGRVPRKPTTAHAALAGHGAHHRPAPAAAGDAGDSSSASGSGAGGGAAAASAQR